MFSNVFTCADIMGGWVRKGPKICWRNIWIVLKAALRVHEANPNMLIIVGGIVGGGFLGPAFIAPIRLPNQVILTLLL